MTGASVGGQDDGCPPLVDRRQIINALFYLLRMGCQWCALPKEFVHYSTVYSCFRRWRLDGTLQMLHEHLRQRVRLAVGQKTHPTAAVFDSQSVKAWSTGWARAVRAVVWADAGYNGAPFTAWVQNRCGWNVEIVRRND